MRWRGWAALGLAVVLAGTAASSSAGSSSARDTRAPPESPGVSGFHISTEDRFLDPPVPLDMVRGFDPPPEPWLAGHRGLDLRAPTGTPVLSPGAGVVMFAGTVVNRGVVVVLHPSGLRSSLEPVEAAVVVGQQVSAGEVVGGLTADASHCAPASCLHWGVRRGDVYLDPLDVLRGFGPIRLLPLD